MRIVGLGGQEQGFLTTVNNRELAAFINFILRNVAGLSLWGLGGLYVPRYERE